MARFMILIKLHLSRTAIVDLSAICRLDHYQHIVPTPPLDRDQESPPPPSVRLAPPPHADPFPPRPWGRRGRQRRRALPVQPLDGLQGRPEQRLRDVRQLQPRYDDPHL